MPRADRSEARQKRKSNKKVDHAPLIRQVQEILTTKRPVSPARAPLKPLTDTQRRYGSSIHHSRVTFGVGPAGTGKTWYAAALAADAYQNGDIERIVVTRPAVESGEQLGFMPGDLHEKYEPYFRPVRDALEERLGSGQIEYMLKAGILEARPLAFLRGATLKHCWVIADEMQNTTPAQMKMFLTRIGENSRFIINGDITQKDIDGPSGLADALRRLRGIQHVSVVQFDSADIVRDPMCQAIAEAYESNPMSERYIADTSNDNDAASDHMEGVRATLRA